MESLISNLVNFFLLSSAMVIVALIIRTVMQKKLNISVMMLIWVVVLIRMIVPFTLNAPIHVSDFILSEPEIIESSDVLSVNQDTSITLLDESNTNNIAINQTQMANTKPIAEDKTVELDAESMPNTLTQFLKALNYKKIALWIWVIGVFVAFATHMIKLLIFRSKILPYMRRVNQTNILFKNQKRIGLFKMVSMYECDCIDMPITMGLFAPKVIIPRGLVSKISSEKLDMILTHELCHIKRYDLLKAYLWLVTKSIHWFNPFVYMAYNAYLEDMESKVDETVVSYFDGEAKLIYSEALVDVIKLAKFSDEPYALISFCKDKTKLRKRVIQMIDPNKKSKFVGVISVLLIMVAMVGCFTTACMKTDKSEKINENQELNFIELRLSKQEAIDVAKKYAITDADDYSYIGYRVESDAIIHTVASDDYETQYEIYDMDGSILRASIYSENLLKQPTDGGLDKTKAESLAKKVAEQYWGDNEIKILVCEVDTLNRANVYGILSNGEVKRDFSIYFNSYGDIMMMESDYPQEYIEKNEDLGKSYYKAKQQVLDKVKEISITDAVDYNYCLYNYDGYEGHQVSADNGMTNYIINAQNKVVEHFFTMLYPKTDSLSITMDEAEEYALQLAEKIWGKAKRKVIFSDDSENEFTFSIDEKGKDAGKLCDITIGLNGDGQPTLVQLNTLMNTGQVKINVKAEPVVVDTKEEDSESKEIKEQDEPKPVGTEERAIEIAMSYNISGAKSMTYDGSTLYNEYKIHKLMADDDTYTGYNIYDFDGSIHYMGTAMNDIFDKEVNISIEEAQVKAYEYINLYYSRCDDINIQVTKYEKGDGWAAGFTVKGNISCTSTGIKREVHMFLNANGELRSIGSEIFPESFFVISDELIEKASQYALTDSKEVEYGDSLKFDDDVIHIFQLDDRKSSVRLLESDGRLLAFSTKLYSAKESLNISEQDARDIVLSEYKNYFPDCEINITSFGLVKDLDPYIIIDVSGELIYSNGEKEKIVCDVNGKGQLLSIGIVVDTSKITSSNFTVQE